MNFLMFWFSNFNIYCNSRIVPTIFISDKHSSAKLKSLHKIPALSRLSMEVFIASRIVCIFASYGADNLLLSLSQHNWMNKSSHFFTATSNILSHTKDSQTILLLFMLFFLYHERNFLRELTLRCWPSKWSDVKNIKVRVIEKKVCQLDAFQ